MPGEEEVSRHCWDNSPGPSQLLCVVSTPADFPTPLGWAGQAAVLANLSCCKAHGKGKRKFLVQDKALCSPGLDSCWFIHYPYAHEYALLIWISHMNMPLTLIVLLPEHTSKPSNSATILQSKTYYCLSRFKNRSDSFLCHISLPTAVLGQR